MKLYVASVDVHVDDADKKQSVAADDTSIDNDHKWRRLEVDRSIDLMQHEGESAADLLGELDLPAGKITQIRLDIDTSQPNVATFNGSDCDLDTTLVDTQGLKINHVFKAFDSQEGGEQKFYLDFDLSSSLTASGNCFRLAPHIKLARVKIDGKDQAL